MIFYYLAKCIYSFDRALFTVKNCADRLFEYFEVLLFVRLNIWNIQGVKSNIYYPLLFFTFPQGQKAAEAAWDICMLCGKGVTGESMARK